MAGGASWEFPKIKVGGGGDLIYAVLTPPPPKKNTALLIGDRDDKHKTGMTLK